MIMLRTNCGFDGWNDTYNIGEARLDAQRKALVEQFHEALDAFGDSGRTKASRGLYDKLVEHIGIHFAAEERLMKDVGYPELQYHKRVHKVLMTEAATINRRLQNDVDTVTLRTDAGFLWSLVIGHLTLCDVKLRDHLLQCGRASGEPRRIDRKEYARFRMPSSFTSPGLLVNGPD